MIVSSDEEIYEKKYGTTLFRKPRADRKSTRLNSSHSQISYAVFCLKKKNHQECIILRIATRQKRPRENRITLSSHRRLPRARPRLTPRERILHLLLS